MSNKDKVSGTCKWFNVKRGFGFITQGNGDPGIFVHQSAIIHPDNGFRKLIEGETVKYDVSEDADGRSKAINVEYTEESRKEALDARRHRKIAARNKKV